MFILSGEGVPVNRIQLAADPIPGSCAAIALDLEEALPGTAPHAAGVLAIEDPGPWGPKLPAGSSWLPLDVGAHLDRNAADANVRLQLIRRPGRRPRDHHHFTVLAAHTGPQRPWLERLSVTHPNDLVDIDLNTLADAEPPGIGTQQTDPHLLVCTHARRDPCCARIGRALVKALTSLDSDLEVWETTHTGGHRFAPNLLVLPTGALYGRVALSDAVRTVICARAGRLMIEHLRGRLALTPPAQVAEVAARRLGGWDMPDDMSLRVVAQADPDTWFEAATPQGTLQIQITRAPTNGPRPVSCNAEPTDPWCYEVRSLTPVS